MSPCSKNLQHSHHTLADMIIKIIFLKSNKNLWLMKMKELLKEMAGIVKHGFFFRARKYLSYYHGELWENSVPSKATLHKHLHTHFHINSPDICHHVVTLHRYCNRKCSWYYKNLPREIQGRDLTLTATLTCLSLQTKRLRSIHKISQWRGP